MRCVGKSVTKSKEEFIAVKKQTRLTLAAVGAVIALSGVWEMLGCGGNGGITVIQTDNLQAVSTTGDPHDPADPFWNQVNYFVTQVASNIPSLLTGAPFDVTAKAAYNDSNLYVWLSWRDPTGTESVRRIWTFNGTTWSKSGDEDRIGVHWPIGTVQNFPTLGCAALCHRDGPPEELEGYAMHAGSGERADQWHWKAARGNIVGYSDDKYLADETWAGTGQEEAAHHSDAGTSTYSDNKDGPDGGPRYAWNGVLSYDGSGNFLALADAIEIAGSAVAGKAVFDANCAVCHGAGAVGGVGPRLVDLTREDPFTEINNAIRQGVPDTIMPAWGDGNPPDLTDQQITDVISYIQALTPIPREVLRDPAGSRGDVRAHGVYADGSWWVVLRRALNTGNNDDRQFAGAGEAVPFGLAIMDSHGELHYVSMIQTLEFLQ